MLRRDLIERVCALEVQKLLLCSEASSKAPKIALEFPNWGGDPCLACLSGHPSEFSLFLPLGSEQPSICSLDCLEKNHSWNCLEGHEWCLEDRTLKDTVLLKVRITFLTVDLFGVHFAGCRARLSKTYADYGPRGGVSPAARDGCLLFLLQLQGGESSQ